MGVLNVFLDVFYMYALFKVPSWIFTFVAPSWSLMTSAEVIIASLFMRS